MKISKKVILYSVFLIFIAGFCVIFQEQTFAAPGALLDGEFADKPGEGYQPLVPLPQKFFTGADTYNLPNYLKGMFKFLIAISGLLAVVMIVIGGIQYMSTDAIDGKSDGKEKIGNAVLGLVLALVSWLILYSINPQLLEFNFNPENPSAANSPNSSSGTVQIRAVPTNDTGNINSGGGNGVPGSAIQQT